VFETKPFISFSVANTAIRLPCKDITKLSPSLQDSKTTDDEQIDTGTFYL
jgi:hypothetical protein